MVSENNWFSAFSILEIQRPITFIPTSSDRYWYLLIDMIPNTNIKLEKSTLSKKFSIVSYKILNIYE